MSWVTLLVSAIVYTAVGLFFASFGDDRDNAVRITIFFTWPIIITLFLLCAVVFVICGSILGVVKLIEFVLGLFLGGDSDGVV